MERYRTSKTEYVIEALSNNMRIKRLLTPPQNAAYNIISVEEGKVIPGSNEAKDLLKPFNQMSTRMKAQSKCWGILFRNKINDYVYRKGNGGMSNYLQKFYFLLKCCLLRSPANMASYQSCEVGNDLK